MMCFLNMHAVQNSNTGVMSCLQFENEKSYIIVPVIVPYYKNM